MGEKGKVVMSVKSLAKKYGEIEVLKKIDLDIHEGEVISIVGPSGSGKSTVANLIPRFWDVAEGEIRIGGVNIKNIPTEKLKTASTAGGM